jgi:ribose transport system substrate-binding protein
LRRKPFGSQAKAPAPLRRIAGRQRVTLTAVGLLALFASGCNREHKKVIAVIPKGNSDLFWQSVHAGAVKAARENNVDVAWDGPATETDYGVQLQKVDAMLSRRVDAIALAPIDRQALVSVVNRAADRKVPVIIFDSGIDTDRFVAQVATDNYKAGQIAAERMGKILDGKGTLVIVAVKPGAASTEAREKGFEDVIHQKFPGIKILDKRYGMAQALRNRSRKAKLVGFDWTPTLLDDLQSGLIDSLVIQDPFQMGYQAVIAAVKHLAGQPVTKITDLAPRLIDRENLNDAAIQAQLHPDLQKYLE